MTWSKLTPKSGSYTLSLEETISDALLPSGLEKMKKLQRPSRVASFTAMTTLKREAVCSHRKSHEQESEDLSGSAT